MNSGTWVQCTICDGHVPEVLFLSKRGINSDHQTVRMQKFDPAGNFLQIQGMYGGFQCAVNINVMYI